MGRSVRQEQEREAGSAVNRAAPCMHNPGYRPPVERFAFYRTMIVGIVRANSRVFRAGRCGVSMETAPSKSAAASVRLTQVVVSIRVVRLKLERLPVEAGGVVEAALVCRQQEGRT